MYKWISVVAIGSNIFSNKKFVEKKFRILLGNSNCLNRPLFDMTSVSTMNVISYDYDWMPTVLYNDDFDTQHACNSINQLETHNDVDDTLSTNQNLDINQINNELNQYYLYTNEMPVIETMNEIDYENCDNADEGRWKDRIKKHRKSSNFGFTSLQKRIERVKNDIINLTNKLNSGYVQNPDEPTINCGVNTYYNLGYGNMMDNELSLSDEEANKESVENVYDKKTWKCPSQFSSSNPYAELSENTQKILNRFHLNDEPAKGNHDNEIDNTAIIDDELEMEEDDIEFTFCTTQSGLLQNYLNKGTLPIIEEEDEMNYSSEDDTSSIRSTIIDNFMMDIEALETPKSTSLESMEFTESESFITALTNPAAASQVLTDKTSSSYDDADENFSDYARYSSVSSHSSKESLNSNLIERFDNETVTEKTLINHELNYDSTVLERSFKDCSSSSMKVDEGTDSEAEYDPSTWSNEDILQSVEQSDSLYEKPTRSLIKSSLPDLIETSDSLDLNNRNRYIGNRNLNKSTDLDEILQQLSPCHQSTMNRLSMSLCNLNSTKSENKIYPSRFFQDTVSNSNLLETDLDSGFVSIYQPIRETEILPSVDFSVSMLNINQDKSPSAFNSLFEKLRSKAGSIPELRIANSLNKLNVPDWLNFRQDEIGESPLTSKDSQRPFTSYSLHLPPNKVSQSSSKHMSSLPRQHKLIVNEPLIKPALMNPVILPSQKLRQSSQKKLTPIKSCRAREYLLPNKVAMGIS